jgi:hypothetical protein
METLFIGLEMLRWLLSRLGPYVLLEIALPGGTLLALLLYLYRRRNSSIGRDLPLPPLRTAMASTPTFAERRRLSGLSRSASSFKTASAQACTFGLPDQRSMQCCFGPRAP